MNKSYDEYHLLTEKLEEIDSALRGSCDDIDCDKYIYRYLLKKRYKPVLKHSYSCITHLKRNKEAVMRLLSLKKFRKFRYKACRVCKKTFDSLGEDFTILHFSRPIKHEGRKFYEADLVSVHKSCRRKVPTPEGWRKM